MRFTKNSVGLSIFSKYYNPFLITYQMKKKLFSFLQLLNPYKWKLCLPEFEYPLNQTKKRDQYFRIIIEK